MIESSDFVPNTGTSNSSPPSGGGIQASDFIGSTPANNSLKLTTLPPSNDIGLNNTPRPVGDGSANIHATGTQNWRGQNIPASIPTKNLVGYDAQKDIRTFQLPGGGVYSQDKNNNIVHGGHTTYGGVKGQAGMQRDDIIPAGLGGTNANPNNIRMVPNDVAHQQDVVETNLSRQVKSGQIQPKAAITEALSQKQQIVDQPSFFNKVGNFFGNIGTTLKQNFIPSAKEAVKNTAKDVAEVPGILAGQGKEIWKSAYVAPKNNTPQEGYGSALKTIINLPLSVIGNLVAKPIAEVGVTEAEALKGHGISYTRPLLFGAHGIDVQGSQSVYDDSIKAGQSPAQAFTNSMLHLTGNLAVAVPIGLGITKLGVENFSPESLLKTIEVSRQDALEISKGDPNNVVPKEVYDAYKNLNPAEKSLVAKNLLDASPTAEPSLLGRVLGVTPKEAQNLFDQIKANKQGGVISEAPKELTTPEPQLTKLPPTNDLGTVAPKEAVMPKAESISPDLQPLAQEAQKYVYHGTADINLESIAKDGLKPMGRGLTSLSKDEAYARSYAESSRFPSKEGQGTMLRINADYVKGETVTGKPNRPVPDQMHEVLTKKTIPPEAIEIFKDGKWQPLKTNPLIAEARKYKSAEEFVKAVTEDRGGVGHPDYAPAKRLVETGINDTPITNFGFKPDEKITIYRGVDRASQKTIAEGDYVALSHDLAKSYTGGKVISMEVPASSIRVASGDGLTAKDFANRNEMHIEAVYNPKPLIKQSQLTDIYNQAKGVKPNLPEIKHKEDTSVTLGAGFNPGVDKFIAEDVKPALQQAKNAASIIKESIQRSARGIRGVLNADAPVRQKFGQEPYSKVIRAIHNPEAERVTFDNNFKETEKWFDKFSNDQQKNFSLTRGNPQTPEGIKLKTEALNTLPPELKDPEVQKAITQASDYVFDLANKNGLDLNYFEDYFRGTYKNPGKVQAFLDYWKSTENYKKTKVFPTIADAQAYGLELKDPNPIRNIGSELDAVSKRVGLKQLRESIEANPVNKTFGIKTEEATAVQKQTWDTIKDPVFNGMLFEPDYARLVNNLISTNKVSQNGFTKVVRQLNQTVMQVKFTGSLFHAGNELKAAVSQEALGITDPRGYVDFIKSFKPIDESTPAYKDYVGLGGGHKYSLESQSQSQLSTALDRLQRGNLLGATTHGVVGVVKTPIEVVRFLFDKFIPKLKYLKYTQDVTAGETKLGRPLTDAEKIQIIKRNQNFYGEMNERLFGRSGTATSGARLFFQAPGYGEGNFRALGKAAMGDKGSARFIAHSLLTTLVLAVIGTRILTGKWPDKPKKGRDVRDLFKIKTNQKDGNGDTIYYDAMTYDKDYYSTLGNALTGQFSQIGPDLTTRLSGSIGVLPKAMTDMASILEGKMVVDFKGSPIFQVSDTTQQKVTKFLAYEGATLTPISFGTFQQSRQKGVGLTTSIAGAVIGTRPTTSEEVKHLKVIRTDLFSLQDGKKNEQIRLNKLAGENLDEAEKEAKDFNKRQMDNLKTLFKEYPGTNVVRSQYFLMNLNPGKKTSGTTINTVNKTP